MIPFIKLFFLKPVRFVWNKNNSSFVVITFTGNSIYLHRSSSKRKKKSVHTDKTMGHHSEMKGQSPCENEYKKFCMEGGDCYSLSDEEFVGSNCTRLFGGKRCEKKYSWWACLEKMGKNLIQI